MFPGENAAAHLGRPNITEHDPAVMDVGGLGELLGAR